MTIITDGTGHSYRSKVDTRNNLHVRANQVQIELEQALDKQLYQAVWGSFTLTTATASSVAYLKSDDTVAPLVLAYILVSVGPSTGGSGMVRLRMVKNVTTGTIVSDATVASLVPANFESATTPSATIYKGGQGKTVTDGTTIFDVGIPLNSLFHETGMSWILTNGKSVAVEITPPTGNTSMQVYVNAKVFFIDKDLYL